MKFGSGTKTFLKKSNYFLDSAKQVAKVTAGTCVTNTRL
jgi:hypothetical protein